MILKYIFALLMAGVTTAVSAANPPAWDEFSVRYVHDGSTQEGVIKPLDKVSRKWNICVLFPHMKDSLWLAAGYGVIDEAERLGMNANILQAGGYSDLPKQVNQFDNCLSSGADAIVVSPISEAGLYNQIEKAKEAGIPVVGLLNPIKDAPVTSKIFVDFVLDATLGGEALVEKLGSNGGKVVAFPGPQGSGWAETYMMGFRNALRDTNVTVLAEMFGDTGVSVQLQLVENALQTYPEISAIWGSAPTIEAAVGVLADSGREDVQLISSYQNQAMLNMMKQGQILGFNAQYPVLQARAAITVAARILEGLDYESEYLVVPKFIDSESLDTVRLNTMFAPNDWAPVFSTK